MIVDDLKSAKQAVREQLNKIGNPKIAFIGQRASDFLIFEELVPIDLIICLDYGKDAEIINEFIPVISLEQRLKVRDKWYSTKLAQIFSEPDLSNKVLELLPPGSVLLPYASNKTIETFAKNNNLKVFNNSARIRSRFENKIKLNEIRNTLGLPNSSRIVKLSDVKAFVGLGDKLVVQQAEGSSGMGTFIVQDDKDLVGLETAIGEENVVVTPFIKGPTASISAVITSKQVIILPPSIQVIKNQETALNPNTFSGIDFNVKINDEDRKQLINISEKVGSYMRLRGYRGVFNLNIMVSKMQLTDINARFMGSAHLTTEVQIDNGEVPISLIHLMEFLDMDFRISKSMTEKIASTKNGSFLVLHSLEKNTRKINGSLEIGEYDFKRRGMVNTKNAIKLRSLSNGSCLVAGSIPQVGKSIKPDAPLLRIFTKESVLDQRSLMLNKKYKMVCRKVYKSLLAP